MFRRHGGLKKTEGLSRPLKWQARLEPAARGGLHLGVEDHLVSSLLTGESRTVWTLPHTISRQAKAPVHRGFAAPQLMRDASVQFSCDPLGYGFFASPTTESQTGQSIHQKANHPSQAHHLSRGQVSAGDIAPIAFTAPQRINRDCVNWLETLTCNLQLQ